VRRVSGVVFVFLVLAGCTAPRRHGVSTSDARARSAAPADVQSATDRLVQSMVRHPAIAGGTRPIVEVNAVENRTGDGVATKPITDRLRTALVKTRMVRFTPVSPASRATLARARQEVPGQVVAAAGAGSKKSGYLLYAAVDPSTHAGSYRLTLALVNLDTGGIEWQGSQEILPPGAGS
jgi:PBP1b-binding outer membrane lipoprotein LpoB